MTMVDAAKFSCSACGREFAWKPELAGKKARCKCGQSIIIPVHVNAGATEASAARPAKAQAKQQPVAAGSRTASKSPSAAKPAAPQDKAAPQKSPALPVQREISLQPPEPETPPAPVAPTSKKKKPEPVANDDSIYGFKEEAKQHGKEAPAGPQTSCPSCNANLAQGAVLCVACGYNTKTGKKVSLGEPASDSEKKGFLARFRRKKADSGSEIKPAESSAATGKAKWISVGIISLGLIAMGLGTCVYLDVINMADAEAPYGGIAEAVGGKMVVVMILDALGLVSLIVGSKMGKKKAE